MGLLFCVRHNHDSDVLLRAEGFAVTTGTETVPFPVCMCVCVCVCVCVYVYTCVCLIFVSLCGQCVC